jgi:hypothetical protein
MTVAVRPHSDHNVARAKRAIKGAGAPTTPRSILAPEAHNQIKRSCFLEQRRSVQPNAQLVTRSTRTLSPSGLGINHSFEGGAPVCEMLGFCPGAPAPRQRQTHREAGTQSHGPSGGSRVTKRSEYYELGLIVSCRLSRARDRHPHNFYVNKVLVLNGPSSRPCGH